MRISVVGTGHVGLTTAVCLASVGHEVLGVDEDAEKIGLIAGGRSPFHEPELQDMLQQEPTLGRLRVSTDVSDAARQRDVIFICVGTPTSQGGEADLSQVERVTRTIAHALDGYSVITEKSTVPVGTGQAILRTMQEAAAPGAEFDVASNPEFLQEGRAVADALRPPRIVVGTSSERAEQLLREVYRPIVEQSGATFVTTDIATAEMIKHASNALLATRISFMNQVAELCERSNADVEVVAQAMGLDPRIGPHFLKAGIGYGGECFPKDVQAFRYTAEQHGVDMSLLSEVEKVNTGRKQRFVDKIRAALGSLEDKRIAVWGLSFKPGTDDLRGSPAVEIARRLSTSGAYVTAYDPVAMDAAQALLPNVDMAADPLEAARDANCVALCSEWPEFAEVDLSTLRKVMARPVIVDGRNALDPWAAYNAGFLYISTGRPMVMGVLPEGEG
jgi:UDPglucose 6-dehydrogenase